jgi:hypothetical protein
MPDDEKAAVTDAPNEAATDDATSTATANPEDDWPDGLRDVVAKERKAARDAIRQRAELEKRVREFEDSQKTESEKAAERLSEFERRALEAETRLLRIEVASEKGLDPKFADLLAGGDRDTMEAAADRLLELAKASQPTPTAADFDGGARQNGDAAQVDMNAFIRDGARRR